MSDKLDFTDEETLARLVAENAKFRANPARPGAWLNDQSLNMARSAAANAAASISDNAEASHDMPKTAMSRAKV